MLFIYSFYLFFSCMMNWSSCGSNVKRKADRLSKGWTLNIHWSRNFMNVNSSWHSYKTATNDMYITFLHKAFFAFTRFIILLWRKKITIFNLHWNLHFLDFSTVRCTCVKCEMDAHCTLLVIKAIIILSTCLHHHTFVLMFYVFSGSVFGRYCTFFLRSF